MESLHSLTTKCSFRNMKTVAILTCLTPCFIPVRKFQAPKQMLP